MEIRNPIFKRVPPGDRWQYYGVVDGRIYPTLTDALEAHFQSSKVRKYMIDAGAGIVYTLDEAPDPEPEIQQFSIYGDY